MKKEPKKFSRKWRERYWFCGVRLHHSQMNYRLWNTYFRRPTHIVLFLGPDIPNGKVVLYPIPHSGHGTPIPPPKTARLFMPPSDSMPPLENDWTGPPEVLNPNGTGGTDA